MKNKIPDIIIVDDHEVMREGLAFMLENLNIAKVIGHASNGKEFLELLKTKQPDIVLMDVKMPVMNGVEATKLALAEYPDLRVLILTMQTDNELYNELLELGIKGFVLKESPSEEIEKAFDAVMKDSHYFSQELLMKLIHYHNTKKETSVTRREKDILELLCLGLSNYEIADKLHVSARTVEKQRSDLLIKTGCKNSISLVVFAIKNKIIQL